MTNSKSQSWTQPHIFFPLAGDKNRGENKLADFIKSCHAQQVTDIVALINKNNLTDLLRAIFSHSPYLSRLLFRDVHFAKTLLSQPLDTLFEQIMFDLRENLPTEKDTNQISKILRQAKARVALIISFADLSGQWSLRNITRRLSEFAEMSVTLVVSHLLRIEMIKGNLALPPHLWDTELDQLIANRELAKGTGYVVLAMGKLGGFELNYSSDIDLIILYDNDIVQYTGRKTAQDLFIKMTKKLVKVMQERTAEGYVFRTDLRLRPDPGATAIALSMEGAEIYYQSMGLNWERGAMIKARPVAGDIQAGFDFLARIKSFVWRKHLDYAALEDIYSIKKLIHRHHKHKNSHFAGQDIKLGFGGIREIEFYAQIFQLIAGGREPDLRRPATCDALNALEKNQKLSAQDNQKLQQAYVYFRTLEHRLQMINDDQTHSMPESEEDLERITRFMGYQKQSDFEKILNQHLHTVNELFTNLLKESHQDEEENGPELVFLTGNYRSETLDFISSAGYEDPKAIHDIIQVWLLGRYRACRTARARKLLQSFIPDILSNFAKQGNSDTSFKKFDQFLSRLPSGVQFFSLIKAQPWLLELLSEIIGIAPNLSDQLAKRPLLLDAVLNHDFFEATFIHKDLSKHLEDQLDLAKDFQDILDITRKWAGEHKFQVGVQILRNQIDARTASKNLSMVADVTLEIMLANVAQEFAQKHGEIPGADFAVIALGKLGGHELTTTSDLDLVFIYDIKTAAPFSNGPKRLSCNHYIVRLSQQYINALTAMTGEGKLYNVDMRLRPSGNAGPIAVTLESFAEYQKENAWTWEHLALTRSRVIVGTPKFRTKIIQVIDQALTQKARILDKLLQETADMRQKLVKEFGTEDIWAVKHVRGGLVDIEFICQYLILKHCGDKPQIRVANTLDQITQLKIHRILTNKIGEKLFQACAFIQSLQVILRLCHGSSSQFSKSFHDKPQGLFDTLCKRFEVDSMAQLEKKIIKTQKTVYDIYQKIIEIPAKSP